MVDDVAYEHRDEHQADVLNVVDDAVGGAQHFNGNEFRHAGPHGAGNE